MISNSSGVPVLPLGTTQIGAEGLRVEEQECVICFGAFTGYGDGIQCSPFRTGKTSVAERHFICNECFEAYVESESRTDDLDLLAKRGGNVLCPECKQVGPRRRDTAYNDAEVAQHVSADTFRLYNEGKKKLVETQLAKEMEEEMNRRLEMELRRREQQTEEQRKIDTARRDIEDLLNLKCPRCGTVFVDFSGCMALTCRKAGCNAAFCAWCQKDCGTNAHPHVLSCTAPQEAGEQAPNDYYCRSLDVWKRVQAHRQRKTVEQYLRALPNEIRSRVAQICAKTLLDAGVTGVYEQYIAN
eukprot:SAG31_NODE_5377_length_2576_cov_1.652806_1_plen_299_part_00